MKTIKIVLSIYPWLTKIILQVYTKYSEDVKFPST